MKIPTSDAPLITTWSFSRLMQWERCPYSVYLAGVEKEPGPERDEKHPLERGNRIHKLAEDFVQGEITTLPKELRKFDADFDDLRTAYQEGRAFIEEPWGFDQDWGSVDWSADSVWCRIKCDAVVHPEEGVATIIDHKTGKKTGNEIKHATQGHLYAVGAFMRDPSLEVIQTEFWYLDKGGKMVKRIRRDQIGPLVQAFNRRAEKMTRATEYRPKPTRYACDFCDFGRRSGTAVCAFDVSEVA